MGDEGIVLTDREREALAGLAEQIGDPWLARQLAGGDPSPPPKARRKLSGVKERLFRLTAGWIGFVLVVAGALLAIATFTTSTLLGAAGLVLMGFGGYRVAADKGNDLMLRLKKATERRVQRGPRPPRPPHTPPGAA